MTYVFADCELDTRLYTLRRGERVMRLRPKVFQVLTYLLTHRDRVVSRHELSEQVWPEQFISETALESCIKAARQALGDSGRVQRLIQTLRGHGYRFVATVEIHPAGPSGEAPTPVSPPQAPLATPTQDRMPVAPDAAVPAQGKEGVAEDPTAEIPAASHPLIAERKLVTLVCCALANSLALRERLGLDGLYSQMHELYTLVQSELQHYGGTLRHVVGDCFIAVFGIPVVQEDHAQRAVLAALGLQQRVQARQDSHDTLPDAGFAVHVGIHTGIVAVGGIGESLEMTAMVGDTAILATALQKAAEPGMILCSEATARLVQGGVQLAAITPIQVAGQAAPLPAYTVHRREAPYVSMPQRARHAFGQFVGRERELDTLHDLLTQVEAGRGHVVGLVGEPGIGKSRLLHEFRVGVADRALTYVQGRCVSYGTATPYLPMLDLMRDYCGLTDADPPDVLATRVRQCLAEVGLAPDERAPYLLQLLGLQVDAARLATLSPPAIKARTFETLRQMYINGSRRHPLVLEIEDLHWIDATSEECLALVVESLASYPILVLTTYRPGYRPSWLDKSYATQVALQRLPLRDSRQVLDAILQSADLPGALLQDLLAKADGNPFFLEELAQTIREQGTQHPALSVPDTVQAVLAARIDRLPATEKRLLQMAAVIGKDVPVPLLQAIAALPEERLHKGLLQLQTLEFLHETRFAPDSAYTFKHVLTQEVAYQSLLQNIRQQVHQQIAQALATHFPDTVEMRPELLAYHYTEAGLYEPAVACWQQAGQRASEHSAHLEAIAHLTQGLTVLERLPHTPQRLQQELALQTALGPVLMATRGYSAPEVEHAYTRAQELCQQVGETPQLFPVLFGLGVFYLVRAQYQTVHTLGTSLLHLAQHADDPGLLLEAHGLLGVASYYRGEGAPARTHFEHALALYDASQHHPHTFVYGREPGIACRANLAWILWWLGYPDQAATCAQLALTSAHALAHPLSLVYAAFFAARLYQQRREVSQMQVCLETVQALAAEHGFALWAARATILHGWGLAAQGHTDTGLAEMHQGLETCRRIGATMWEPSWLGLVAEVYGQAGQVKAGLALLAEALELVAKHDERVEEAELHRRRGELLLKRPVRKGARRLTAEAVLCFHQARDMARRQGARMWELRAVLRLSQLLAEQGQHHEARSMLEETYGWFTEGFETADVQAARVLLAAL